jgi:hypothetical protein
MGKYAMVVALLVGLSNSAFARDDGRYANDTLKHWFDNLTRTYLKITDWDRSAINVE